MISSSIKMIFSAIFLLTLFLISKGQSGQLDNLSKKTVPRIENSSCLVQIPEGVKAECGNLFVKENRHQLKSRIIKLPFIIIKSSAAEPAPDPVLYTAGGPGVGSFGMVRGAQNLAPYTNERDFIIFEQRGTEYAEPSLQCPEVNSAIQGNWMRNLSADEALRNEVQAAKSCHDRLVRQGVDLSAYNSAESAADIEDLRRVLGVKQLNLYGISYSTRLMLNYVREYQKNVRSVILDSVLPPTVNWDETGVDGVVNSLNKIFAACAAQKECASRYPNLRKEFYSLVEAADKKPVIVDAVKDNKTYSIKINGSAIVDFIYNLLENTRLLSQIPFTIDALKKGDYSFLKTYAEDNLSGGGFIWGMRYSVWCNEEMPFENRRNIAAQTTKYPELKGFKIQGAFPNICRVWNVPAANLIENKPVKGSIPILIFSGEFDPDTPPAWGKIVASWFSNSYFYAVKNTSHAVMNNRCTFAQIPASFIKNPKSAPDVTCLSEINQLEFK